ncbi:MAG: sialate O-acetylesterase [Clostridia bacterium]|nr:sialate O-acetylesterase [Clostridia bacterium]
MKKKILAVALALAIIVSGAFVCIPLFGVAAEENRVLISDCETLTGWTKTSGNALVVHNGGLTGKAVAADINCGAFRDCSFTAPTAVDISSCERVEWDVMMHSGGQPGMWDDIKATYGDEVYVKIGSSASDYNLYRLSKMTVTQNETNNLWYHFSVTLNNYTGTSGKFDPSKMSYFTFTTKDGGVSSSVRNGHIRIDNLYAVGTAGGSTEPDPGPGPEPTNDAVITECESLAGWSYSGNIDNVTVSPNGLTAGAVQVYVGFGALRKLTYSVSADLSAYNVIEFDMMSIKVGDSTYAYWDDIVAAYGDNIRFEVAGAAGTATYALEKWDVTPLGNGWYHVAVPLNQKTGGTLDLAHFQSFSISTNINSALVQSVPNGNFRFDNVIARYDESADGPSEEEPDEEGVWKINDTYSATNNGSFQFVAKNFEYNLSKYQKSDLYLTMRVYVKNTDGTNNVLNFSGDGQLELTSSGQSDVQELNWSVPKLGLKSGWNELRLCLANGNNAKQDFDLSKINYLRFYNRPIAGSTDTYEVKITDIALTNKREERIVSSYYADGMIIARNKPINISGNAQKDGAVVTAVLSKGNTEVATATTTADKNGAFTVKLPAQQGGYEAYSLELLVDGASKQKIEDILFGEVWLAAGQSNMEYFVSQTIKNYDYSLVPLNQYVRVFDEPLVPGGVTSALSATPTSDVPEAKWVDGSNAMNVIYTSAIGYYMSLQLQEKLDVPVGFINAAKGASVIESWLPREAIENDSVIKSTLEKRGLYKDVASLGKTSSNWTYLTTLYNTKVAPLAGIGISGLLWYQGESNIKYADDNGYNTFYEHALTALINSYSADFGFSGNMPVLCAHLAPYNYSSVRSDYMTILADFSVMLSNVTKNAKAKVLQLPIYDLSLNFYDPPLNNPDPIHPNSKYAVGLRFADAALSGVYGKGTADAATAPVATSYTVSGNKITVKVRNVGTGLNTVSGSTVYGFAVADSSRVFTKATAKIVSKDTVEVYNPNITKPVAVTYAWSSFPLQANLCNSNGIPAVPYRSDEVKSVYYLSMDWADCNDLSTWNALTSTDAGYQPAFSTSATAALSLDTSDAYEGGTAVKMTYSGANGYMTPVLNYGGTVKQYQNYSGITVYAKAKTTAQLSVQIVSADEIYNATIVTGTKRATSYTVGKDQYTAYTFNFARLTNSEDKVLSDSTGVLKNMTELRFAVTGTDATVLFDDITLRTDVLPTPGSATDEITDAAADTSAGSIDSKGNMWLSDCDTLTGITVSGATVTTDKENLTQGKGSAAVTAVNGNLRQFVVLPGTALDISQYDYLEFDVYFSNMEWFNSCTSMMFELTSSGAADNESDRYMKGYLRDNETEFYTNAVSGTAEPGWYHLKLRLGSAQTQVRGGLDMKRFNYFRFFAIGSPAGTADCDIKFDNMKFTKDAGGSDKPQSADPSFGQKINGSSMYMTNGDTLAYWNSSVGNPQLDTANKTEGNSSVTVTVPGGLLKQISYVPGVPLDISAYRYMEFDVYFSNLDWFDKTGSMMFELTSAGKCDDQSARYTKSSILEASAQFASDVYAGKGGGWYHFKLDLDNPHTSVRGGLNKSKFNYFRFYTVDVQSGTKDYVLNFDNLTFTKGNSGDGPLSADPSYGKKIDSNSMYMTDGDASAYWKSSVGDPQLNRKLKTQGNSSVSVTVPGGLLKQISYVPSASINVSDYRYLEFDVYFSNLDWFNKAGGTMFELTSAGKCDYESSRFTKSSMLEACPKFAADIDAGKGGGWYHFKLDLDRPHAEVRGGLNKSAFNYFRFYTVDVEKGTKDYTIAFDNMRFVKGEKAPGIIKNDRYMILSDCDSSFGWSCRQEIRVDTKNKVEGTGSVSVLAPGGVLKQLAFIPSEPLDISKYHTLQFDMFLSDITCLQTSTGFMVELTSSGTCDKESDRYTRSLILLACPELAQDLTEGNKGNKWYHFEFDLDKPQSSVNGGLNKKAFNFFRIYFLGCDEGTPDCMVYIDNLRLTAEGGSTANNNPVEPIVFMRSEAAGKNVGNKVNGGLKGAELTPYPQKLADKIEQLRTIIIGLGAGAVVFFIIPFFFRKKKKKDEATK